MNVAWLMTLELPIATHLCQFGVPFLSLEQVKLYTLNMTHTIHLANNSLRIATSLKETWKGHVTLLFSQIIGNIFEMVEDSDIVTVEN